VCKVLKDEGFIREFSVDARENNKRVLVIELKYEEGRGVIRQIDRVSKPGRRVYSKVTEMPRFYNGLGILVVSTPNGVMADHKARAANVGGEILCQVF
jgi:small subunit ribosomal protein S8